MSDTGSLIIGHMGQDGTILRELLDAAGESWIGIGRDGPVDVTNSADLQRLIAETQPKRVFYLAAAHRSASEDGGASVFQQYQDELAVNVQGVLNCLEAIRQGSPESRFVFASSSLVFAPSEGLIDEESLMAPAESYAIEKALAGRACAAYRERHGLHASVAYLFNHESEHRRPGFFSRHVTDSICAILAGTGDHIEIGDPDAMVDWSCARDVVRAMLAISDCPTAGDFVVASGEPHSIREFLAHAFTVAGLDLDQYLRVNRARLRRQARQRIGCSRKLREHTRWQPQTRFADMVTRLTQAALKRACTGDTA